MHSAGAHLRVVLRRLCLATKMGTKMVRLPPMRALRPIDTRHANTSVWYLPWADLQCARARVSRTALHKNNTECHMGSKACLCLACRRACRRECRREHDRAQCRQPRALAASE